MPEPLGRITTYSNVIAARYNPSKFVGRKWLIEEITRFRDDEERRHLVIVGEPGSGKSALLAYLAQAWNCPLHFIRVGSIDGVTGVDPRHFLLSLGAQLRQKYGRQIFEQAQEGSTSVLVGLASNKAEIVGRLIHKFYTLPFLDDPHRDVRVSAGVVTGQSHVVGEDIKELINSAGLLDETTLLHIALINPLRKIEQFFPTEKVVILIDALDEAFHHTGVRIPDILPRATDAEFPANLRLIMTSRPGEVTNTFRSDDLLHLDDKKKGYWQANQQDIQSYIEKRLAEAPFAGLIAAWKREEVDDYVVQVVERSQNNFLYLYYFFNELAASIRINHVDLRNFDIPKGLSEIYRSFAVEKIRKNVEDVIQFTVLGEIPPSLLPQLKAKPTISNVEVSGQKVLMTTTDSDQVMFLLAGWLRDIGVQITTPHLQKAEQLGVWEEKYLPILGVMAVAYEPLHREQIAGFAGVEVVYVDSVLARLKQFLDEVVDEQATAYQFYHTSFSEYLLDSQQNRDYPLDGAKYHAQIASYYREERAIWQDVKNDLAEQSRREYGLKYYITHLFQAQEWQWLFAGLDTVEYGQAKLRFDPSTYAFAQDLELGRRAAMSEKWTLDEGIDRLPHLWRYTLLRFSLSSRADLYPPSAFRLLVLLGHKQEALDLAELLTNPPHQIHILLQIAGLLQERENNEAESLQVLVRTYKRMQQTRQDEQDSVRHELIAALREARQWDMVESVIATIADPDWRDGEWSDLSSRLGQVKQWEQAQRVLHFIEDDYTRDRALCNLSETFALEQDWNQAKRIFSTIVHKDLQVQALCQFGAILAAKQEHEQAGTMWAEAEKIIDRIDDGQAEGLKKLSLSLAQAGHWEQTEKTIRSIESADTQIESWLEVTITCTQAQQWEHVQSSLAEIEITLRAIENSEARMQLLVELGRALTQAQQWHLAERVTLMLEDTATRNTALHELTIALIQMQQWQLAEHTSHRIENPDTRTALLQQLSIALSEKQQWQQAESVLDTLEAGDGKNRALLHLSIQLARALEWEQAQRVCHRLESAYSRAVVFSHLGALAAEAEQWLQAASLWAEAEALINTIEDCDLQVWALSWMEVYFLSAGQTEQAENALSRTEEIISTIEEMHTRNQAWYNLAKALMEVHRWVEAESVICRIQDNLIDRLPLIVKNIIPVKRVSALEDLVRALIEAQQWEHAERIIHRTDEEFQKGDHLPEWGYLRGELLYKLARGLLRSQRWQQAERISCLLEELKKKQYHLRVWWDESESARGWWDRDERTKRAYAWWMLGEELAHSGQLQQAEAVYEIARTLTYALEKHETQDEALRALAQAFMHIKRWDNAAQFIHTITTSRVQDAAWKDLETALIQAQEWERAISIISLFQDNDAQSNTRQELTAALIQAQEWERTARAICTMMERNRDEALTDLCSVLIQQHQWDEVLKVISLLVKKYLQVNELKRLGTALVHAGEWERAGRIILMLNYWSKQQFDILTELALAWTHKSGAGETLLPEEEALCSEARLELATVLALAQEEEQVAIFWTTFANTLYGQSWLNSYEQAWLVGYLGTLLTQPQNPKNAVMLWEKIKLIIDSYFESLGCQDTIYQGLSTLFMRVRQWDLAERTISLIRDEEISFNASYKLLETLTQNREWDRSEKLVLTKAKLSWVAGSFYYKWLEALLQAKEVTLLIRFISTHDNPLFIEGIQEEARKGLINLGEWKHAEWLIDTIKDKEAQTQALMQLVEALMLAMQWEQAEQILHRITSSAFSHSNTVNEFDLSRLLAKLIQARGWEAAEKLLRNIESDTTRARVWCQLSKALAKIQCYKYGTMALARAEALIQTLQYNRSLQQVLYYQATALAELHQWEHAEAFVQVIKENEERNRTLLWDWGIEDEKWSNELLCDLAITFAKAQQWDRAERVAEMIKDRDLFIKAYQTLAEQMNATEDYQRLLHFIQSVLWKVSTREEALKYFPLATMLIPNRPAIGIAFFEAFLWVDTFLRG